MSEEKEQETDADLLTDTDNTVDFAEVARRKQASRDEDERALDSGEKSREDLRLENSIFAPFGKPKVNLIGLKPLGKKPLR